jgi:hypothetical protein
MLLSNLGKSEKIEALFGLKTGRLEDLTETSVLGQLMEVFVVGEGKKWNRHANFDFLANVWGDLTRVGTSFFCLGANKSQFSAGRRYLLTASVDTPDHYPFQSLLQFTNHSAVVRRSGTANAIKYLVPSPAQLTCAETRASIPNFTTSSYPPTKSIFFPPCSSPSASLKNSPTKTLMICLQSCNSFLRHTNEKNRIR